MKAARFHGRKDIRIDNIPEPELRPGTVRLKVAWCGICGTDLHEYLEGPIFIPSPGHPHPLSHEEPPVTMGHEFSGTVEAVGEGVTDIAVGENAVVEPYFVCKAEGCLHLEGNERSIVIVLRYEAILGGSEGVHNCVDQRDDQTSRYGRSLGSGSAFAGRRDVVGHREALRSGPLSLKIECGGTSARIATPDEQSASSMYGSRSARVIGGP